MPSKMLFSRYVVLACWVAVTLFSSAFLSSRVVSAEADENQQQEQEQQVVDNMGNMQASYGEDGGGDCMEDGARSDDYRARIDDIVRNQLMLLEEEEEGEGTTGGDEIVEFEDIDEEYEHEEGRELLSFCRHAWMSCVDWDICFEHYPQAIVGPNWGWTNLIERDHYVCEIFIDGHKSCMRYEADKVGDVKIDMIEQSIGVTLVEPWKMSEVQLHVGKKFLPKHAVLKRRFTNNFNEFNRIRVFEDNPMDHVKFRYLRALGNNIVYAALHLTVCQDVPTTSPTQLPTSTPTEPNQPTSTPTVPAPTSAPTELAVVKGYMHCPDKATCLPACPGSSCSILADHVYGWSNTITTNGQLCYILNEQDTCTVGDADAVAIADVDCNKSTQKCIIYPRNGMKVYYASAWYDDVNYLPSSGSCDYLEWKKIKGPFTPQKDTLQYRILDLSAEATKVAIYAEFVVPP